MALARNFILAVFFWGIMATLPAALSASDFDKAAAAETPELSDGALEMMDEDGQQVLQEVLEKDELDESMKSEVGNVRSDALKQTAYTLALQQAVKWRYGKIKKALEEHEAKLNRIFDFPSLLMHGGKVVPPVITEAGPGYRVESDTRASSTEVVYQIIKPARMVSRAPDWRDYLWADYPSFAKEDVGVGVLPKDAKERKMWKKAAVRGWETGLRQAERLYQTNLNKLTRDYQGIIKFRTLAEQDMVSLPALAEGRPGIEVEGKRLSVDRKIFRITQPSSFREEDRWKPKIGVE